MSGHRAITAAYCDFMAQENWQAQLTRMVASQVRRYRTERGMSAQALADRCEQLGFAIPRPVLSNLENGRRESVSLAEVLVLAAALDVPPIELALPLGVQEEIEILPGLVAPTWDAARWVEGSSAPAVEAEGSARPRLSFHERGAPTVADHYRAYDATVKAWRQLLQHMAEAEAAGDAAAARTYGAAAQNSVREIAAIRHRIYARGLLVPPPPPELASLPDPEQPVSSSENTA
jgi:transcriptional regulator with XRE-family HTH domain